MGESVYHFLQGGLAGGLGAFVSTDQLEGHTGLTESGGLSHRSGENSVRSHDATPCDETHAPRLQNQRSTVVGEVLYRSPADCVRKVYANEGGVRGFYKGVIPQLVGVAPEK